MQDDLIERLKMHRIILKSGDYNGADLMAAWCDMINAANQGKEDNDRIAALEAKLAEKDALLREVTSEPTPCPSCHGQGRIWVYRIDDRKYPKKCNKCEGTGIVRTTLAKIKDATDAD